MSEREAPSAGAEDADHGKPPGRFRRWLREHALRLKVTGLFTLLILVYLAPDILYSVYPGQAAVVWYRFYGGTDVDDVRSEGLRIKFPWDIAYVYDIRLREEGEVFNVLTADGLPVDVHVSVRFRLFKDGLGALHKHVGPDYVRILIFPEVGAQVRERISQYRPVDLWTIRREQIQAEILEQLRAALLVGYEFGADLERAIHVEDVLIRGIVLPVKVEEAIKDKLAQEQRMLEFDYRLQNEEKEARRKEIEAEGIRRFQDIVAEGISERYLKWKGIDATLELARSNNAKIVVIGASEDGLPIILGGIDSLPTGLGAAGGGAPPAAAGPQGAAAPAGTAPPTEPPPQ